jgi:hypothetical protein
MVGMSQALLQGKDGTELQEPELCNAVSLPPEKKLLLQGGHPAVFI